MNTILGFVCERKYTGIVIVAVTIIIVLILSKKRKKSKIKIYAKCRRKGNR